MIRVTYHAPQTEPGVQGVEFPGVQLLTAVHSEAESADVSQEHLYLYDSANKRVGGYAPGWVRWEVVSA